MLNDSTKLSLQQAGAASHSNCGCLSRRAFIGDAIAISGSALAFPASLVKAANLDTSDKWAAENKALRLSVDRDGSYEIFVFGKRWLASAPTTVHCGGSWHSTRTSDGTVAALSITGIGAKHSADRLGSYRSHTTLWNAGGVPFETTFRVYTERPCIVFSQSFPQGATGTALPANIPPSVQNEIDGINGRINASGAATAFPAFRISELPDLKHLFYAGCFAYPQLGKRLDNFLGGLESGVPLVLFDSTLNTAVLSPLNHFISAVQIKSANFADSLVCGVNGEVSSIPPGFKQEFILYAGQGVNRTMFDWGSVLLDLGNKKRGSGAYDRTLRYLGYWTDNGSYYYYNTEPSKNYQITMLDLAAHLHDNHVPVKYLQFDSWWYYKGSDRGVALWKPRSDVFPDGLRWLHEKLDMPFVGHSRYWSKENQYNGRYTFVSGKDGSVPTDGRFWDHLMRQARLDGICLYEQDWLNEQIERVEAVRKDALLAEQWLGQMDEAALAHDISVMYCMPLPSFYLASTCYSSVTQIRATTDYNPGNHQWRIGLNSLLAWSLGLAPFKDNFWSTEHQPGSVYGSSAVEPNSRLQALVSALSCGAIGPSDKIGYVDKSLILKVCRADGLLLKPDKPATPLDKCFMPDGPSGDVWDTYVRLGGKQWHYLLVANQPMPCEITLADLGLASSYVVLDSDSGKLATFDATNHLVVGPMTSERPDRVMPFRYFIMAPRDETGIAFLGEIDKFITVSRERFTAISTNSRTVAFTGSPGEVVKLAWQCPRKPDLIEIYKRNFHASRPSFVASDHSLDYDAARGLLQVTVLMPPCGQASVRLSH